MLRSLFSSCAAAGLPIVFEFSSLHWALIRKSYKRCYSIQKSLKQYHNPAYPNPSHAHMSLDHSAPPSTAAELPDVPSLGSLSRRVSSVPSFDEARRRSSCLQIAADIFPPAPLLASEKETMQAGQPGLAKRLRLFATGCVVVLGGSFHFGYQISLINPLADVLQDFVNSSVSNTHNITLDEDANKVVWPLVAGLLFIGSFIGAMLSPKAMQCMGLRSFFCFSSVILIFSFLLSFSSRLLWSSELFVLGRFLSGIGIGMYTTTQAVYLTEISPVRYRGFMGSLTGFSKSIGFVLASGIGIPQFLGTADLWHWAFLLECIPSITVLIGMALVFYDSPVYLLKKGDEKGAHKCLELYHSKTRASQRVPELYAELEKYKQRKDAGDTSFSAMWANLAVRRAFFICFVINTTVSFSGIMAASFFGTLLLQSIGFDDSKAAIANFLASFSGLLGNVVGTLTIDRVGRRALIIGGLFSLAILNTALMFIDFFKGFDDIFAAYAFLAVFMLFLFVFSLGVGPLALFIATELTTAEYRPWMQSVSISTQYLTCFISPSIFFPLWKSEGAITFLMFIVPLLLTSVYLYFVLPETKNRPIDAIVDDLASGRLGLDDNASDASGSMAAFTIDPVPPISSPPTAVLPSIAQISLPTAPTTLQEVENALPPTIMEASTEVEMQHQRQH
uniref:MFS domain-containing protein n=1 Tax=Panagrellus redivivus TaxID=6233 RepID=A0A7E4UZJ2_PANRE